MSSDSSSSKAFLPAQGHSRDVLDVRERVRVRIEEEVEKHREALGKDYELVKDFARKFYLAKEAGSALVLYEGSKVFPRLFRLFFSSSCPCR